jgi:CubicO group peptidase (beta-lactamase class C family)
MKMVKGSLVAVTLGIFALQACSTGASRKPALITSNAVTDASESVKEAYKQRADALLLRGTAIGIISGASLPQKLFFGDAKSQTDLFEIGSVSKSFTGIAAALLSDKELDEPISKYIKKLRKFQSVGNITARQLATHTSGLVDALSDSSGNVLQDYDENQLITFLEGTKLSSPGQKSYSDVGFATLGLLLSKINKKKFPDVIRDEVLKPLGMSNTSFMTSGEKPNRLLQGYDVRLEPAGFHRLSSLASASGGLYSDLHDMCLFLNANIHPDGSELGNAIKRSHDLGFGWDSVPRATPIWKNGGMPDGFSSYLVFDPTPGKEYGAIVLANTLNISVAMGLGSIAIGLNDMSLLPQWPISLELTPTFSSELTPGVRVL